MVRGNRVLSGEWWMVNSVTMKIQSYKELEVWRVAMDLVDLIYDVTASFPAEERFGLSQQMRRCAVSIPSNIAEGSARAGTRELVQFIHISKGSLAELETQVLIARRRHYINNEVAFQKISNLITSVGKMLARLSRSLQTKLQSPPTIHHPPSTRIKESL